ncbi:MAG: leucine-rich repeat domain-containing protein [Clostridia bacterium]|nr:leucine-rich repeat domain-containing protein [Clostridia bacterium]
MPGFTIPASVTKIGANAFGTCYSASFSYGGTVEQWKAMDKPEDWYTGMEYVHVECADGVTGHKEIVTKGYAATATREGLTDGIHCGICGDTIAVPTVIPATGKESEGLAYATTSDYSCMITNIHYCDDYDILVPQYINGYRVTEIAGAAFANNKNIKYVTLQQSVTRIGSAAFEGSDILEITIGEGVMSIAEGAFRNCEKLKTVHIPANVSVISNTAFSGCTSLEGFTVDEDNAYYKAVDGVLYTADGKELICYPLGKSAESYSVEAGVQTIGSNAFMGSNTLKQVVIPEGVTEIGAKAFYECKSIENAEIPQTVALIGEGAFYYCEALTGITLPEGVETIENDTFSGCTALSAAVLPQSLKAIGSYAFSNCVSLAAAELPEGLESIGTSAFYNCKKLENAEIPQTVVSIGERAFYGCKLMNKAVIPEGVTAIPNYAFTDCTALESVVLHGGVTSIGEYAFGDCTSLKSIEIPEGVTNIGYCAFSGCTALEGIVLPSTVYMLGEDAFEFCTSLKTAVISADTVNGSAFRNCTSLEKVTVSEGTRRLAGYYIFEDCTALTEINLPKSLVEINGYVFNGCENLAVINYGGTAAEWQSITKYSGWNDGTGTYTVYCTDGTVAKNGTVTYA